MFLSGCLLGGILDTYRVVTGQLKLTRWLVPVFDVLYWLAAMVIVFRVLYWSNYGEVRVFVFLGLIAGVAIYYTLMSATVIRIILLVITSLKACWRFSVRLFRLLVIAPLRMIIRMLSALLMFFGATTIFLCKFVLQLVYPLWKLLLRLMLAIARLLRLDRVVMLMRLDRVGKFMRIDRAAEWIRSIINRIRRR